MISDEVVNEVKQRLADGFRPDKIILFASQVRGTADGRSDADILVACPARKTDGPLCRPGIGLQGA
jgi:predicted nucleotidyltransferase